MLWHRRIPYDARAPASWAQGALRRPQGLSLLHVPPVAAHLCPLRWNDAFGRTGKQSEASRSSRPEVPPLNPFRDASDELRKVKTLSPGMLTAGIVRLFPFRSTEVIL